MACATGVDKVSYQPQLLTEYSIRLLGVISACQWEVIARGYENN